VVEAYWLLVRVPLAARAPAFTPALRALGVVVPDDLGIVDLGGSGTPPPSTPG
jgi:hypothetical protein